MLRTLDLFSGIGGFSLGLERTGGYETVAFCEIEAFPRRVLAKHWPEVPCYDDVRTLTADRLRADGISVDVICGGFPCQDISSAGKGAGIEGARSGLWSEFARLIGELRPLLVIVENVPALRTRGADRVLDDLEALDYACEPVVVGAVHAGAPHRRQRAWLVAHAGHGRLAEWARSTGREGRERPAIGSQPRRDGEAWPVAHPHNGQGRRLVPVGEQDRRDAHAGGDGPQGAPGDAAHTVGGLVRQQPGRSGRTRRAGSALPAVNGADRHVADADEQRQCHVHHDGRGAEGGGEEGREQFTGNSCCVAHLADADGRGQPQHTQRNGRSFGGLEAPRRNDAVRLRDDVANTEGERRPIQPQGSGGEPAMVRAVAGVAECGWWGFEPDVGRVAHGVPQRVDRLRALGNAVVPQVIEAIGRAALVSLAHTLEEAA